MLERTPRGNTHSKTKYKMHARGPTHIRTLRGDFHFTVARFVGIPTLFLFVVICYALPEVSTPTQLNSQGCVFSMSSPHSYSSGDDISAWHPAGRTNKYMPAVHLSSFPPSPPQTTPHCQSCARCAKGLARTLRGPGRPIEESSLM